MNLLDVRGRNIIDDLKFNLETLWKVLKYIWVLPLIGFLVVKGGMDFKELGPYGDFVAGTTVPVLTFLSFIAIVITLKMQREQLEIQSEELKNSIEEMRATRGEFEEQNKNLSIQRFDNTFFNMITLHNDIVNSLKFEEQSSAIVRTGRDVLSYVYNRLKLNYRAYSKSNEFWDLDEIEQINLSYEGIFNTHQQILGHYFRNLYRIVKFIDQAEILTNQEKKTYIGILRAQISSNELALLLYNSLSPFGTKFLFLMYRYNLLDNLNIGILINPLHYELYKKLGKKINRYNSIMNK